MNKNKEWLKSEVTMRISGDREKGPLINVDIGLQQALDLINQLDEPEKVVIPKFVADYLEGCKENERNLFEVYESAHKEVSNWIFDPEKKAERIELVARAWLEDGYTVEQEKRYQLCCYLPQASEGKFYLTYATSQEEWYINDYVSTNVLRKTIFTETELLKIDETGFERVEVE